MTRPKRACSANRRARTHDIPPVGRAGREIGAAEMALRVDLAAAFRFAALMGWDDLLATHMSARLSDADGLFLLNPSGLFFDEITASSLVVVDEAGQVVGDDGAAVNPAGFTIHSAVHDACPDAHCVIHLHTMAGTAVSALEDGLMPLSQTAMLLGGKLGYHDYEGIVFDAEEQPRLIAALGNNRALLLRNHGTLSIGSTVADAMQTMYFLERACSIQVAAQGCGSKLRLPDAKVRDKVAAQTNWFSDVADRLLWPAILRRLDRIDPSYRD